MNPRQKPGSQGRIHFAILADPQNPDLVYLGGDRQDAPFPNLIGARYQDGVSEPIVRYRCAKVLNSPFVADDLVPLVHAAIVPGIAFEIGC